MALLHNEIAHARDPCTKIVVAVIGQPKPKAMALPILVKDLRTAKVGGLTIPLFAIKLLKPSAAAYRHGINR